MTQRNPGGWHKKHDNEKNYITPWQLQIEKNSKFNCELKTAYETSK